jgi:CBS domain-containing protein
MLVRDVMTSPAVTIRPNLPLKRVAHLLDAHSITALPVIDTDGRLVGVLSEADVLLDAVPSDPRTHETLRPVAATPVFLRASDVMNHHPVSVSPATDVAEALDLMASMSIKSLPVIDNGVVVGVVSRRDVVRMLARTDDAIAADVDELVRGLDNDWLIDVSDCIVTATGPEDERERDIVRSLAATVPGVVAVRFL